MARETVGYWIQREETEEQYFGEYAGHNETWRVHVGETPILRCNAPHSRWSTASRRATRVRYYFWNRLGASGSAQIDETPTIGVHVKQFDDFDLARNVDSGDARLADGYKVITVGEYRNGEPMRRVVKADGSPF